MKELIVEHGTVVTGGRFPDIWEDGAVVISGDRIVAVGPRHALKKDYPKAESMDAGGGLVLPGFINMHHHFYSQLAVGLDPGQEIADFYQCLDRFWWRIDRAHTPQTIRASAQMAALDCIRQGCTTVFDHHASPAHIPGSLDIIGEVLQQAGMSAVLCYEVTDRNGHEAALAGLDENLRFFQQQREDPRVRGMLGFHASFTLRDDTLAQAQEKMDPEMGCHIHAAEAGIDQAETLKHHGVSIMTRLRRYGLLGPRTILAHGLFLETAERKLAGQSGSVLVYNPESNANNSVGQLDLGMSRACGVDIALGTDGMTSSMLSTLRAGWLSSRAAGGLLNAGSRVLSGILETNARVARRFFDEPSLGILTAGAPADVAVVDYQPVTPIDPGNWFGHLVYGAALRGVRHTLARGRVLMADYSISALDSETAAQQGKSAAQDLWRRFGDIDSGTPVLGSGGCLSTANR